MYTSRTFIVNSNDKLIYKGTGIHFGLKLNNLYLELDK